MTDTTPTTELIILKTDKLGRVQTTAEDRESWLDAFEQSGMSGAAFARLHGIKYTTFAYVFEQLGVLKTWMNLPYGYESGAAIAGQLKFAGESLASMGLEEDETFEVRLPGDQTISAKVIPEPSGIAMIGLVSGLIAFTRRFFAA